MLYELFKSLSGWPRMHKIRVNEKSLRLVRKIQPLSQSLGIRVSKLENGTHVIDAGVMTRGGFEAGRIITEICLGGLGEAQLTATSIGDLVLPAITVATNWPAISTLGIQAGYSLIQNDETRIVGTGPARVLAQKPKELYDFLDFTDDSSTAVIVLQMDELPSPHTAGLIAEQCRVDPKALHIIVTPGNSLAGAAQIAGRAVEDVAFTMHEILHFDVRKIRHMVGTAPIAPICRNPRMAACTPDDFISYGGRVFLTLESVERESLNELARSLVFESTPVHGRTFSELLKEAGYDFRKIEGYPGIFRPAEVTINVLDTGSIYRAGRVNAKMIVKCLGLTGAR